MEISFFDLCVWTIIKVSNCIFTSYISFSYLCVSDLNHMLLAMKGGLASFLSCCKESAMWRRGGPEKLFCHEVFGKSLAIL